MNQLYNSKNKERFLPFLPVLCISVLPALYLFAHNSFLCPLTEVLLPMAISLGIGLIGYWGLYFLFGRNSFFSALLGTLCMALFSYFSLMRSLAEIITGSERSYFAYALALIVAVIAGVLLYRVRKKKALRYVTAGLSFFLGVIVVMNIVSSVPGVIQRKRIVPAQIEAVTVDESSKMPNFYFIITDEYAEFDTMETYFYYDLSPFHDFLTENGFSVSSASYNATIMTRYNIANDLCLRNDAAISGMSESEVLQAAANGQIYQTLNDLGYSTVGISNIDDLFACPSVLSSFDDMGVKAISVSGKTPTKLLLDQSMLISLSWRIPDNSWVGTAPSQIMDYLADPDFYQAESNSAVLCYIMSPHRPYSHTATGEIRDRQDWYDITNPQYYLDQHIYTTSRLEEILSTILSKDRDCVIVLQSDHNFRSSSADNEPTLSGVDLPYSEQRRILNVVYSRGEPIDIDGLSGPDTLRLVLTKLGATLDP